MLNDFRGGKLLVGISVRLTWRVFLVRHQCLHL